MSTLVTSHGKPDSDQIAALAYRLYVENGRQDGHAEADWLRAEQMLAGHGCDNSDASRKDEFHAPAPGEKKSPPVAGPKNQAAQTSATDRQAVRQHVVHPAARHQ